MLVLYRLILVLYKNKVFPRKSTVYKVPTKVAKVTSFLVSRFFKHWTCIIGNLWKTNLFRFWFWGGGCVCLCVQI